MIPEVLSEFAAASTHPFEDRRGLVGASEIGQCKRKIFFSRNAAPDAGYEDRWGSAFRGKLIEEHYWLPALRARFGNNLLYAGAQQRRLVQGVLAATPDGMLANQPRDLLADLGIDDIGEDGSVVVECKSTDPRKRVDAPNVAHVYQVQTQLGLIRDLTAYRPEVAVISYINASFVDDVIEFAVRFDREIFEHAKALATEILTASAAADLPPDGYINGGGECETCPYAKACGVLRHTLPPEPQPELDPQVVAELVDLARAVRECRDNIAATTETARGLEHALKQRLKEKGVRYVVSDGIEINWIRVKGRTRYDLEAIREDATKLGLDIGVYEIVGAASSRLMIESTTSAVSLQRKEEHHS
jgi:hypothetical protein